MNLIKKKNKYYRELDIVMFIHGDLKFNLYFVAKKELNEKNLLNTTSYYYVKNHYKEWYIGKFNGQSFDFINDQGNFDSNLFTCKEILATTDESLKINDKSLPRVSLGFMEMYMTNYNLGGSITSIFAEYIFFPGSYTHVDCETCGGDGGYKNTCFDCKGHGSNMIELSEAEYALKVNEFNNQISLNYKIDTYS